MATRVRMTGEGLLIPREVAERALGEGSGEVEVVEEPGRLLIAPAAPAPEDRASGEDPILLLGEDPVDDPELPADASVNHDLYLYGRGG
jgi:hypothetical protein